MENTCNIDTLLKRNVSCDVKEILNDECFHFCKVKAKKVVLHNLYSGDKLIINNNILIEVDIPKLFNNLLICKEKKILIIRASMDYDYDELRIELIPLFSVA
jgi:hypothetical protein